MKALNRPVLEPYRSMSRDKMAEWFVVPTNQRQTPQQLSTAVVYGKMLAQLYPHSLDKRKIKGSPTNELELVHNWKLVHQGLIRLEVYKEMDISQLIKPNSVAGFEFCRWWISFYETNIAHKETPVAKKRFQHLKIETPMVHPAATPQPFAQKMTAITPPQEEETGIVEIDWLKKEPPTEDEIIKATRENGLHEEPSVVPYDELRTYILTGGTPRRVVSRRRVTVATSTPRIRKEWMDLLSHSLERNEQGKKNEYVLKKEEQEYEESNEEKEYVVNNEGKKNEIKTEEKEDKIQEDGIDEDRPKETKKERTPFTMILRSATKKKKH